MVAASVAQTASARGAGRSSRRHVGALGFLPFIAYTLLFLAVPAVFAVGSGFFDSAGHFTLANFSAFADPTIQSAFLGSFFVSGISAIISAVVGALICWALTAMAPAGLLRTAVEAMSSVLAQFGGVMLAFAWIATVGSGGLLSGLLKSVFSFDMNANGPFLYSIPGLLLPYTYFGVPLMVLSFLPAIAGLRPQWGEASATLGGTRRSYWLKVGFPILAPAFFGSLILLFANAFSSFATAAALIDQGGIVPLTIQQQLTSETILNVANVAGVLALGMVVIIGGLMAAYGALGRRAARWRS